MKTPPPETVPYEKFEIEKNAKNKAYDFILSRGYFEDWVSFNKSYQGDAHSNCINTLKSNIMKEVINIQMCEEREESAKSFLERLTDEDDLATVVNTLDDVMSILIDYTVEIKTDEHKKNNGALSMIFFLNRTIDALKYIGTHDILKKEG